MKVTKGNPEAEDKKVIAFYATGELVFRDKNSDRNFALNCQKTVYAGYANFDIYLEVCQSRAGFIAFYEGDTIIIEL